MARGDEGRERAPNSAFSEKRTVLEIAGLADAMEDQVNVVSAMPQHFVEAAQREGGDFVEFHRCPDGDVRYRVARTVGLAENMGVAMVAVGFGLVSQTDENADPAFALVRPFAERGVG